MKSPLVPMLLAAAVAGLAGGWVSASLAADDAPREAADGSAAQAERLERQLQSVSDELARVAARLREVELRGAAAAAAAPERQPLQASETPTLHLAEDQLAALTAAVNRSETGSDDVIEDKVAAALTRIREAEDAERDERRAEQRRAALEEQVQRLADELALDTYQTGRMRDVLTAQEAQRDEIFAAARENGTWADMREGMEALRTSTRTTLETFLTPTQLESYDELGTGMGFGGPRWGRGFPGRDEDQGPGGNPGG